MEKTIKIAYLDREWYDAERKTIFGDMGFSFCDSSETRVLASEMEDTLVSNSIDYINSDDCSDDAGDGKTTDFAIYTLHTADATYDTDDYDEKNIGKNLWAVDVDMDTDEVVEVYVCAKKEDAENIIAEEYGMWVSAHYMNELCDEEEGDCVCVPSCKQN